MPKVTIYLANLRLNGDTGEEVMERVEGWGLDTNNEEGVVHFEAIAEEVEVPGNIRVDHPEQKANPLFGPTPADTPPADG